MTGLKPSSVPINVVKLETDVFEVTSKTSGHKYEVDIKNGTCTCPHYKFRMAKINGQCKHIAEVYTYLQEITTNNSQLFSNIKTFIRSKNNYADWQEVAKQFGDDAIDEMLRLQMLFKPSRSRLGVLE